MSILSNVTFWQAVAVALIPTGGALWATRPALRDLGLKRRMETTTKFGELAEKAANAASREGGRIGEAEQIACIWLLASFGRDEKHLREPARAVLANISTWGRKVPEAKGSPVPQAAADALALLPKAKPGRRSSTTANQRDGRA